MSNAYEKLLAHMSDKKIGFWSNREEKAICMDFSGIVGMYRVYARIDGERNQFEVSIRVHVSVAEGCRAAVGETVERANYGLAGGNLEMSFDDSELRFHASEDLSGDDLEGNMIDRMIDAARMALDIYLQAILAVIYGNELPEDVIRHVLTGQYGQSGAR